MSRQPLPGPTAMPNTAPLAALAFCLLTTAPTLAQCTQWTPVGGGTNKLIAKLAVELGKKPPPGCERGAHVVAPGAEAAFMTRFQLGEIPGVGPRLQQRLAELGLRSVSDALPYDEATLRGLLGERVGRWLLAKVRGQCQDPVVAHRECKSIGREETFAVDLHDEAALGLRLRGLLQQAAADLRRAGFCARTLTVKIKDSDFTARQRSRTLATPVQSERVLTTVGLDLLAELRTVRPVGARLLGVGLSSLSCGAEPVAGPPRPPRGQQLTLFAEDEPVPPPAAPSVESERDRKVTRVFDAVRAKFGDAALLPGWEASAAPPSR